MLYEYQYYTTMRFHDLDPLLVGEANNAPGRRVYIPQHEYVCIHLVRRGKGTFTCSRGTFSVHAGQIFSLLPGDSASLLADDEDPWVYRWIGFDGALSHRFSELPPVFDAPPGTFDGLCDPRATDQVLEYKLLSELYFLYAKLLPTVTQTPPDYIQQIKDHIKSHYMEPLTVAGIANSFGLNRSYLTRKFKEATGFSLQAYILEVRYTKSVHYLELGYSVKETAALCGYSNASSFCKAFKKIDGLHLTPLQKRERYANIIQPYRASIADKQPPALPNTAHKGK